MNGPKKNRLTPQTGEKRGKGRGNLGLKKEGRKSEKRIPFSKKKGEKEADSMTLRDRFQKAKEKKREGEKRGRITRRVRRYLAYCLRVTST